MGDRLAAGEPKLMDMVSRSKDALARFHRLLDALSNRDAK
jgi:hypothetical protein